ncbi:MAG TPA: response regulator, partial [Polyangiaceae bacterium]|nr:response regulator [Polyangiaceae bacterium]
DAREDEAAPASSRPPAPAMGRRGRILVVDDEPPIANTLRELLGVEHEVVAATSARECIALIRSGADFEVIFCDLMMPGTSGVELYEQLRAERPGIERKMVFMTGGTFTSRAAEFLASVDNRRVEKPFSLGLVERIAREMMADAPAPR